MYDDRTTIVNEENDRSPQFRLKVSTGNYNILRNVLAVLIFMSVLLLIAVALLAVLYSKSSEASASNAVSDKVTACLDNPSCFFEAGMRKRIMNRNIDPCEDFYSHACGNWTTIGTNILGARDYQKTVRGQIMSSNERKIINIFDKNPKRGGYDSKLKAYYDTCLDTHTRQVKKAQPLITKFFIPNKLGPWYVINGTVTGWALSNAMAVAKAELNTPTLFDFILVPDFQNAQNGKVPAAIELIHRNKRPMRGSRGERIYKASPYGTKYLSRIASFLSQHPFYQRARSAYKEMIKTFGTQLLQDAKSAGVVDASTSTEVLKRRVDQFAADAWNMEWQLILLLNGTAKDFNAHDKEKRVKISDLPSGIEWLKLLNTYYSADTSNPVLTDSTPIINHEPDFIKALSQYLASLQNSDRILNNYIIWRAALNWRHDLSDEYNHAFNVYTDTVTGGRSRTTDMSDYCYNRMGMYFPDGLAGIFVRDHFGDDAKKTIDKMTAAIKKTFADSLTTQSTFFDSDTLAKAITKVRNVTDMVGHSAKLTEQNLRDKYFKLKTDPTFTFFDNEAKRVAFDQANDQTKYSNGYSGFDFWTQVRAYDTYAYFHRIFNQLRIPAGMLQIPVFFKRFPAYSNYGGIGTRIAENIVHSIDRIGRYYPYPKFWSRKNWWSDTTLNSYNSANSGPCYLKMIRSQKVTLKNGATQKVYNMTPSFNEVIEMMSEITGVKNAYKAYRAYVKDNGEDKSLPTLPIPNQMFFISYAQTQCYARRYIYSDYLLRRGYIPENLKVNLAVSQNEDFGKVFRCKASSTMAKLKAANSQCKFM